MIPAIVACAVALSIARGVTVEGEILEGTTNRPLPARLSIQGADGTWHFAQSAAAPGTAVRYDRQRTNTNSVERHTTLSAHPFRVELPAGRYTFTVSHGKEFLSERRDVTVDPKSNSPKLAFRLRRWIDMAKTGWFSGDTHVHRTPAELANVLLAEDVNVALPLLDWTTDTHLAATADPRSTGGQFENKLVSVDATHVWHPRNTEFEFFRVNQRAHRLGALFVLNHRARFDQPVFSLSGVLQQARTEGAMLSLEKHNWEWTIALAAVLEPAVIELANNHLWQTDYTLRNWAVPAPAWMKLSGSGTDTERDWILYGFQSYYALLNCGFRLAPTAGSASGVHPVPLGFSRVYVQLEGPFNYDAWLRGLAAGRSFVTTGPMLIASAAGRWPGAVFDAAKSTDDFALRCSLRSEQPLESIELIVNGEVAQTFAPQNQPDVGAFATEITARFRPRGSSWIAWRCFEKLPAGRLRFAHTAPWHFTVTGQPLRPRRVEAEWLVERVRDEIARSREVAPPDLIAAYERALKLYEGLAAQARDW